MTEITAGSLWCDHHERGLLWEVGRREAGRPDDWYCPECASSTTDDLIDTVAIIAAASFGIL